MKSATNSPSASVSKTSEDTGLNKRKVLLLNSAKPDPEISYVLELNALRVVPSMTIPHHQTQQ